MLRWTGQAGDRRLRDSEIIGFVRDEALKQTRDSSVQ